MVTKLIGLALIAFLAAGSAFAGTKKNAHRKPASVDDCTAAAGKHAESYLHDKMSGDKTIAHHELYKKFPGKNGYNAIVYTYLYKLLDAEGHERGILRVTTNHKCEYTTMGRYDNEKAMEEDDQDAAETPDQ